MPIIYITSKCETHELIFKKTKVCPHLTSIKFDCTRQRKRSMKKSKTYLTYSDRTNHCLRLYHAHFLTDKSTLPKCTYIFFLYKLLILK